MKLYPKIRIHTWGGLGSQLLGVALCIDIRALFPRRSLLLVHHTSGVTERVWEIDQQALDFEVETRADFTHSPGVAHRKAFLRDYFSGLLKYIALVLHFYSASNTDYEFARLKPWVLSIRGHYSNRTLSEDSLNRVAQIIGVSNQIDSEEDNNILGIHYRLGDLVNLENKSYINPETITRFVSKISKSADLSYIHIYSDSPEIISGLLGMNFQDFDIQILSRTSRETISELTNARVFVGTNSKISIWVAIFRQRLWGNRTSYLPIQLKESFCIQNRSVADGRVIFYD